jgi:isoleucyl-tRNA synthetase
VILNRVVTPELEAEGLARDVVRAVQQARKDADLDVSDRIATTLTAAKDVLGAVKTHEDLVKNETLTLEISYSESASLSNAVTVGDSQQVQISVVKL